MQGHLMKQEMLSIALPFIAGLIGKSAVSIAAKLELPEELSTV
jgi:hypothetical protein